MKCAGADTGSIFTDLSLAYKIGSSAANNPLSMDGIVDDLVTERLQKMAMEREPTPPLSPRVNGAELKAGMGHPYLTGDQVVENSKPLFIASLPQLPPDTLSKIPSSPVDFAPEFLHNILGGDLWSPGFTFVPPPQTSILPNRAYYTVDPVHDPHLPAEPGHHGAKLVPFFNINPEDNLDFGLPDDYDSSSEVPLFVLHNISNGSGKLRKRYIYYGHYAQSRWSDKLDYDRMKQCVPACVLEHWAKELSSSDRPGWVTEALQKHFFPAPDYTGTLPGHLEDEGGSITEEDFVNRDQKITKDIVRHVEKLRAWKKEANMRTSMIRKDFILAAFEKVSSTTLFPRNLARVQPNRLYATQFSLVHIASRVCGGNTRD